MEAGIFDAVSVQTLLVFLCMLLAFWLYRCTTLPDNFPEGPRRLPIFGNLGILASNPTHGHRALTELTQQYGKIIGLKLGSHNTVLINGIDEAKEALVKKSEVFSNRPEFMSIITKFVSMYGGRRRGIIWTDGDFWRESRRFAVRSLRDFGLGKRSLEERVQEEAEEVCEQIAKTLGAPRDLTTLFQEATGNIICSICFGSRYDYEDPDFKRLMYMVDFNASSLSFASLLNFIPILSKLPRPPWFKKVMDNVGDMHDFIDKQIEDHRQSFDRNSIRDFIDLYLEKESAPGEQKEEFSRESMKYMVFDLFSAGTETASTTARWIILYLINYLEVQRSCQEEIDREIGSNRRPTVSDRVNTPYVDATVHEVQRLATVVPLSVPHCTAADTTLCQYRIPKNTLVMVNQHAIHMDPDYWQDPEEFRPARWLDPEGHLMKHDSFMPFSMGGRVCLGESLARNEIYLFTTTLLQRFDFRAEDPTHPPPLDGKLGITYLPNRFRVVATSR